MVVNLTNQFFSGKGCSFLVQAHLDTIKFRQVGNWNELYIVLVLWHVLGRHGDRKTHVY